MRHDIAPYRDPFNDMTNVVATVPYHPVRLAVLGLLYSAPISMLIFIMGFGEPGTTLVFLALMGAAVTFATLRAAHGMVSTDLEELEYSVGSFLKVYWLSVVPVAVAIGVGVYKIANLKYAGIVGSVAAGIILFLVIGFVLARVTTWRYVTLWVLVGASWAAGAVAIITQRLFL